MSSVETLEKSVADKKCRDLLEIVTQIVSLAPDKETALDAIGQVGEALQSE